MLVLNMEAFCAKLKRILEKKTDLCESTGCIIWKGFKRKKYGLINVKKTGIEQTHNDACAQSGLHGALWNV